MLDPWQILGLVGVALAISLYALFTSQRARTYALWNTADINTLAEALETYFGMPSGNPDDPQEEDNENGEPPDG